MILKILGTLGGLGLAAYIFLWLRRKYYGGRAA
jgi:hypothetical protein